MSDTETRCRLTPEQRAEEAAFIRNTDGWPLWPKLPMKRPRQGEWPELGIVLSAQASLREPITVYVHDNCELLETLEYATVDALLDDGWIVD